MKNFTLTFKGKATRSLVGETGRGSVVITAWDKSEASLRAERMAQAGMVLSGVKCDEVLVVNIARGKRA